ncbi:MAG TPA: bifunctional methylenetetrahydrofolate dehydrogenase/methenyltetrahydrofolate cyclohydrolase FolD [Armatimonadota bacterium]|nr:bifunctional methylenetetrahydrofolate dehydrogenase/methenyltetrahydrofolate cyclohydrolase FolD [Armatimonadota bacterium]HOM83914.1 bifunctional methylenetetrahydrofolate dehydrogenase/methenyltetrahydrofolate cyclohydrolase FolD [Armatimonadota bacterium]HOQ28175.1 bifunctional methylenetetrahydrofolate dehydrogenase/methenyltetrahydrofolate cyclohydrolase FolD [Armatimonadota bacterium]HPO74602.1 bifunctional methylenetetrahydrofolate dehydrogenase/methenyltetrahydrofolate cyclohydrolase
MAAEIIDGKAIAAEIRAEVARGVAALKESRGIVPGLAAVIVGENPASRTYVNMKRKACAEAGIHSEEYAFPEGISQQDLLSLVGRLNEDPRIHGILVQLPLPEPLDAQEVLAAIDPEKDVDGFHPVNMGRLVLGLPGFVPSTPLGIMELLRRTGVSVAGKHAVVVGRSHIVGKPAALLLLSQHATVTICHSRTADLPEVCRTAEILVVAVGKPEMVRGDWIKPGATVIDVGINRVDGKLLGDVHFESASQVAGAITPVPGGVGPMTIAMLLRNTLDAARRAVA